jgi:hypothetical protein
VTDSGQFGGGKMRQFGDRMRQFGDAPGGGMPGDSQHCAECEAMLTDALDGTLSAADQARFDQHAASCKPCGQLVADARRGAAWLELLRNPAPEPPADLLERILAQTSWAQIHGDAGSIVPGAMHHAAVAPLPFAPAMGGGTAMAPGSSRVIAFPQKTFAAVRRSGFGQIVLQPRLAMTAAMAFFSIALTLNITGIHPTALRAADLEPSSLRRDFFSANARVVQYYEGLRVVYELESRVHDLQSAQDTDPDSPAGSEAAPATAPAQPAAQPAPIPNAAPADKQPGARQHDRGKASANPRTSRREDPMAPRRMVVAETLRPGSLGNERHAHMHHAHVDGRLA